MNTSDSFEALRRANPRTRPGFAKSVEAAGERVRAQTFATPEVAVRRRRLRVPVAGVSLAVAGTVAAFFAFASSGGETATAAVERAAKVSAASAERSGTVVVRITHDGELWAGSTVRWNGSDLAVGRDAPSQPGAAQLRETATGERVADSKTGDHLRVVDGTLYGPDPGTGGWLILGSPKNIDPGSGTTPDEYLAAVRLDTGGVTLHRIMDGIIGLTTTHRVDGSSVYTGKVAAGVIARETGFKEGQSIRVLPFGYVAHDEAADAAAPVDVAVTVGPDDVVREIAVSWGTWVYTATYSGLGATPAPVAPENARSLLELRGLRP
jgi:hypothetical protein